MQATLNKIQAKVDEGLALPIMELFYTIQGEGTFSGQAAIFVRLAGCDVGCHWCDVKESWDAEQHPVLKIEDIVEQCQQYPANLVVITGGEPLMYNLNPLTEALQRAGFQTNIETSGAHPLTGNWDWICLSPKKFKEPLPEILKVAHELKPIIFHKSDFEFAEKYAALVGENCRFLLQPEWGKQDKMLALIIDYVKQNPKWCISLQTHKYMDIP